MFKDIKIELDEVERTFIEASKSEIPLISEINENIASYKGKRLRPGLVILCVRLFRDNKVGGDGYNRSRAIRLATAIELVHTATLIHDDVIDQSQFRRGRPSINSIWDNKISIIYGDYLYSQAVSLLMEDKSRRLYRILQKTVTRIIEGEALQLHRRHDPNLTEEEYLNIIRLKTAELFSIACQAGSVVNKTTRSCEQALINFGRNIGMAFQLTDDLVDITTTKEGAGKSIKKDLQNGDLTYPMIILLKKLAGDDKKRLKNIIKTGPSDRGDEEYISRLVRKNGVINDTKKIALNYIESARENLATLPDVPERKALMKITEFIVNRKH